MVVGMKKPVLREEVTTFSHDLYNFIWMKLGVTIPLTEECVDENPEVIDGSSEEKLFEEEIGKAVILQQLLARDYLRSRFITHSAYILEDADYALDLCLKFEGNDVLRDILRCSALIAEVFLFRKCFCESTDLNEAPGVWIQMFYMKFRDDLLGDHSGWKCISSFAKFCLDRNKPPFDKLFAGSHSPYEDISRHYKMLDFDSFESEKTDLEDKFKGYDLLNITNVTSSLRSARKLQVRDPMKVTKDFFKACDQGGEFVGPTSPIRRCYQESVVPEHLRCSASGPQIGYGPSKDNGNRRRSGYSPTSYQTGHGSGRRSGYSSAHDLTGYGLIYQAGCGPNSRSRTRASSRPGPSTSQSVRQGTTPSKPGSSKTKPGRRL